AFLAVSLAGAAAVGLRLESPNLLDAGWLLIGAVAAIAVFVGARLSRVDDRRSWRVVGVGQMLLAAGAGADLIMRVIGRQDAYPAPADALAVVGCAALGVGLLLAMRVHDAARSRLVVIDSVVLTGAGATAAWVLLLEPHVGAVRTAPLTALIVAGLFVALRALRLALLPPGPPPRAPPSLVG